MGEVCFIGDLHLGHKRVTRFRTEFDSVETHDQFITQSLVSYGNKRKILYLLGDICFDFYSLANLKKIVEAYGKVYMILGNHDLESKERPTIQELLSTGLEIISSGKYKEFWLSHEPIHPIELRGKINIHGHVHLNAIDDNRYMNVSAETINYLPISLESIRAKYKFTWEE